MHILVSSNFKRGNLSDMCWLLGRGDLLSAPQCPTVGFQNVYIPAHRRKRGVTIRRILVTMCQLCWLLRFIFRCIVRLYRSTSQIILHVAFWPKKQHSFEPFMCLDTVRHYFLFSNDVTEPLENRSNTLGKQTVLRDFLFSKDITGPPKTCSVFLENNHTKLFRNASVAFDAAPLA